MITVYRSRRRPVDRLQCLLGRHSWITVTKLYIGHLQVSRVCTRCSHREYADE